MKKNLMLLIIMLIGTAFILSSCGNKADSMKDSAGGKTEDVAKSEEDKTEEDSDKDKKNDKEDEDAGENKEDNEDKEKSDGVFSKTGGLNKKSSSDDEEEENYVDEEIEGTASSGSLDYLNTSFYGVWVSAGNNYDKLYEVVDDLASDGFDDGLVVATADFENLSNNVPYTVTAGKFDNEGDAKTRLEEIKKDGYKDAFVKHTGAYLSDNYYYVTATNGGFEVDEDNGEIWLKDIEVQFPYRTGYEESGASTIMTLYLDKNTVFDPNAQGFGNHEKGESPYEWFVKCYKAANEDPDNNDWSQTLAGVFEVEINGNYIKKYIGSYWWD